MEGDVGAKNDRVRGATGRGVSKNVGEEKVENNK